MVTSGENEDGGITEVGYLQVQTTMYKINKQKKIDCTAQGM